MNERELFLRALAQDEDDVATRLVYADWLDERGEAEEADRQRNWPAAKEWLLRFRQGLMASESAPCPYTYEDLIAIGRRVLLASDAVTYLGDEDVDLGSAVVKCLPEFGRNWSVVTGIALPSDLEEKSYYWRCCANEEYRIAGPDPNQVDESEEPEPADDLDRLQDELADGRRKRKR